MNTWNELSQQFRELLEPLKSTRLDAQWGSSGEYWRFAGSSNKNAVNRYKALSQIAGKKLEGILTPGNTTHAELLAEKNLSWRWYKAIWKLSGNFDYGFIAEEKNQNGEHLGYIQTGTIHDIADAASVLCLEISSEYPEGNEVEKTDNSGFNKYLNWIKTHKIIGFLVFIGIVVIGLGNFTDAIQKITTFASSKLGLTSKINDQISLTIKIKNETDEKIHIKPFMKYYIHENQFVFKDMPTGRLAFPAEDVNVVVPPNSESTHYLQIPDFLKNSYQIKAGKSDISFLIEIEEQYELGLQTIPFIREAFDKFYVKYTVTPNKANAADAKNRAAD